MNPKDIAGSNRVPLSLIPGTAAAQVSVALLSGDLKYGPANWRTQPIKICRYLDAAERHLKLYRDGEDIASDTQVHHLAHAAAGIMILLDAIACESAIDDRPAQAPTSQVMNQLRPIIEKLREDAEKENLRRGAAYQQPLHNHIDALFTHTVTEQLRDIVDQVIHPGTPVRRLREFRVNGGREVRWDIETSDGRRMNSVNPDLLDAVP